MSEKMIFWEKVYLGESMDQTRLDKLKKKIKKKPLLCGEYLIVIPRNPSDQLDILSARWLAQDYYSRNPLRVVGVAATYDEALKVVEQIVQECLRVRGDCALKEFLTC